MHQSEICHECLDNKAPGKKVVWVRGRARLSWAGCRLCAAAEHHILCPTLQTKGKEGREGSRGFSKGLGCRLGFIFSAAAAQLRSLTCLKGLKSQRKAERVKDVATTQVLIPSEVNLSFAGKCRVDYRCWEDFSVPLSASLSKTLQKLSSR